MSQLAYLETTVGKYLNRYMYTDVLPIGKIIGVKSKTTVWVQRVVSEPDPSWKPEYVVGGFSAVCLNNYAQTWLFKETEEIFPVRISKQLLKSVGIDDKPVKHHDYNF